MTTKNSAAIRQVGRVYPGRSPSRQCGARGNLDVTESVSHRFPVCGWLASVSTCERLTIPGKFWPVICPWPTFSCSTAVVKATPPGKPTTKPGTGLKRHERVIAYLEQVAAEKVLPSTPPA